jgi:hypothetical protein
MTKGPLPFLLAFLFVSALTLKAQKNPENSGAWSGVIINSGCTADEAFAEAAKCFDPVPGARLVFYNDTTRQIFDLDPTSVAAGHLGDSVTVSGTLDGTTIRGASLKLLTGIGLDIGQQAPVFSLRDQFGRQQTLDTLKGPKGTVLLFFRSADW